MAYSPKPNTPPLFTNVFVEPSAYRAFLATGRWPDKTIFALEERASSNKGSINQSGHFQTELQGLAVSVKDESRFPEKWAYFSFGVDQQSAPPNPKSACWQCHNEHGAVDNTFVQFYPTLKPVAAKFGIYRPQDQSGRERADSDDCAAIGQPESFESHVAPSLSRRISLMGGPTLPGASSISS
jgi:Cytochrome P460